MSDKKLLTILIPVYNGAKHIGGLLEGFAAFVALDKAGSDFVDCCEVLVINNRSEDATLEIANRYLQRLPNLRVITPDDHKPTAEQNVFRAFKLGRGEYTWVLGVDDYVRFEALPEMLQIARDSKYDVAIFNFMVCDENGHIQTLSNYCMEQPYEGDLVQLTQRVGYWWMIAGFSGQIIRTSRVAKYDHPSLVAKTSPIYSHVTAYLECYAGQPAAIVNIPNVVYRVAGNDPAYWPRVAKRLGIFDEYPWTLGFVRQIAYLEKKGIVGSDYLIKMIDKDHSRFFRITLVIYDKILSQLIRMRTDRDPRNQVTLDEFEELVGFFEQRDLLAKPFLAALRTIFHEIRANNQTVSDSFDEARDLLHAYQCNFLLVAGFTSLHGDYETYTLAGRHYAVHRYFRAALIERIRYLDHAEYAPLVFDAATHAELVQRISEAGIGMDLDLVPAAGMRFCSLPLDRGCQAWNVVYSPQGKKVAAPETAIMLPECSLVVAQRKLREVYKTDRRVAAKFAAWVAASTLKMARKVLQGFTKPATASLPT